MSLATAYKQIENRDSRLPAINEIAKTHARAIVDIIYETYPNLDEIAGVFWNAGIHHREDHIAVELMNGKGCITFSCKNDRSIRCIVWMRARPDSEWEETLETFSESDITTHIKRKRLPKEKRAS